MNLLFSSQKYDMYFDEGYNHLDETDGPYKVINRSTNMVECATSMYPGALEMMVKFEIAIESYEAEINKRNATALIGDTVPPEQEDKSRAEVQSILELVKKRNPPAPDLNAYREWPPEDPV